MAITSANQLELLQTAEAVAREKMIEPELVIEAMEDSLARAAKSRYGAEMDIRVSIDRKTGKPPSPVSARSSRMTRSRITRPRSPSSRHVPIWTIPRSATRSSTRFPPWNWAASPRNPPSR